MTTRPCTRPRHTCAREAGAARAPGAEGAPAADRHGDRLRRPSGPPADAAGADVILVGDSAAMTVLGHDSTVPATMEEMLVLTRAVTRRLPPARRRRHAVGSFQVSDEEAMHNAIRFVKEAGADAVKLEGAGPMISRVRALVGGGIPVMGHFGLTPQSATMLGGFKAQGRTADKAVRLYEDALALRQPAASRSSSRRCRQRSRHGSPRRWRCRRSGSVPAPRPTGRCSCGTTCSASTRGTRPASSSSTPTSPRRSDGRRLLRRGGTRAPLPGGAAHVRDAGRGAGAVRGRSPNP